MPITAKLSREFYQRLGDKVVNEMVDLFNRIDDAARSDLRLLNEQNALRFEARLDQRSAELRGDIEKLGARLDGRIDALDAELHTRIDKLGARLEARMDAQSLAVEKAMHAHTRWMVTMWAVVIGSQIGLWLR